MLSFFYRTYNITIVETAESIMSEPRDGYEIRVCDELRWSTTVSIRYRCTHLCRCSLKNLFFALRYFKRLCAMYVTKIHPHLRCDLTSVIVRLLYLKDIRYHKMYFCWHAKDVDLYCKLLNVDEHINSVGKFVRERPRSG